jgi:hypothetical protein
MDDTSNQHIPSPAHYAAKHTTANAAPTHHKSSTDTTPEKGGTFRALYYMAMTKTKPLHDSPHTTPSSTRNKPRQMICCSKAHQGGANKTPKWVITCKDPPKPSSITFANLYRAKAHAASGKPPEEVITPVTSPKPQWQVVHLGWGKPHPNVGISNPNHPNYVAPPPRRQSIHPASTCAPGGLV